MKHDKQRGQMQSNMGMISKWPRVVDFSIGHGHKRRGMIVDMVHWLKYAFGGGSPSGMPLEVLQQSGGFAQTVPKGDLMNLQSFHEGLGNAEMHAACRSTVIDGMAASPLVPNSHAEE
jgi:hypothetical protein